MRAAHFKAKSPGRAAFISTPKGYNYFHELYTMEEKDKRFKSFQYDYTKSPFLDAEEIELARQTMDPITFASEYLASFAESGNNVFYCFDRKIHVVKSDSPLLWFEAPLHGYRLKDSSTYKEDLKRYDGFTGEDVHACIDFNVGYFTADEKFGELRGHLYETILSQAYIM